MEKISPTRNTIENFIPTIKKLVKAGAKVEITDIALGFEDMDKEILTCRLKISGIDLNKIEEILL